MNTETTAPSRFNRLHTSIFMITFGVIGWLASFELLTEYIHTLKEPGYTPNCNVSVLVTCGLNMASWQGSLLGFSNTILGVAGFVAPIIIGIALIAGVRFPRWFTWCYLAGLGAAQMFVLWLAYQSIFGLGVLCPWCMVVWVATTFLCWSAAGFFIPKFGSWGWVIACVTLLTIAATAQFQLDWVSEFRR